MADNKRLLEDLDAGSQKLKQIGNQKRTPVPGGGGRVFVHAEDMDNTADAIDRAIDVIKGIDDGD